MIIPFHSLMNSQTEPYCWKYCNKIIFKYVNSAVRPSFNLTFTEICTCGFREQCTGPTKKNAKHRLFPFLVQSKLNLRGKVLDFKVCELPPSINNINNKKCFYPKFLFFVCVKLCVLFFLFLFFNLKRCIKKKKYKKSTQENYTWNHEFWLNKID